MLDLTSADSLGVFFTAALLAAFLGGWHCAGMCGAIATLANRPRAAFFYQAGRLFSYLVLGALASSMSARIFTAVNGEIRIWISALLALLSIWILSSAWKMPAFQKLQVNMWRNRPRGSIGTEFLFLGILNGLLPCHWLYGFLFLAAGLQNPARGLVLMFCLWLGSLPWLMGFALFGHHARKISHGATWVARVVLVFIFLGLVAHGLSHSF